MNRIILFLMLSLILLLSSNIFALPLSYAGDYKGNTTVINAAEAGIDAYSAINISEFCVPSEVSSDYIFGYDILGIINDPTGNDDGYDGATAPEVPEPTTIILFGLGMAGIALRRRKV